MGRVYEFGSLGGIFAVPVSVVDKHLKLCGGLSLKVLLMLLRSPDALPSVDEIATKLGMSTGDISDALNYWVEAGVISCTQVDVKEPVVQAAATKAHVSPTPPCDNAESGGEVAQQVAKPNSHKVIGRQRMPRREMLGIIEEDCTLKGLVDAIQTVMGKPLTSTDMDAIVALYTYYGLSAHYIMTVAQFCDAIGKLSMRYIEKTAASWQDDGVTSDNIDEHVSKQLSYRSKEGVVRRMMGINNRALSPGERKYINSWCDTLGLEPELIGAAYDITVMQTGKLSFAYMNKVLVEWHKKGIVTASDASKEREQRRNAPSAAAPNSPAPAFGKAAKPKPANKQGFDAARLEKLIESKLHKDGEAV